MEDQTEEKREDKAREWVVLFLDVMGNSVFLFCFILSPSFCNRNSYRRDYFGMFFLVSPCTVALKVLWHHFWSNKEQDPEIHSDTQCDPWIRHVLSLRLEKFWQLCVGCSWSRSYGSFGSQEKMLSFPLAYAVLLCQISGECNDDHLSISAEPCSQNSRIIFKIIIDIWKL